MNRLDFRYSCGAVTVAFDDVVFTAGVGKLLLGFRSRVSAAWLTDELSTPLLVTGHLYTAPNDLIPIGEVNARVLVLRSYAAVEQLDVELSDRQVLALEQARGGGDMLLYIKLQATLLAPPVGVHAYGEAEVPVRCPASDWIRALAEHERLFGFTVLVPAPIVDSLSASPTVGGLTQASRSQAVHRLRQAQADLRDGRYEDCVSTCRKALETLMRLAPQPGPAATAKVKASERNEAQRWAMLHHDLHSLTSAAHHDDDATLRFSWSKADAEAILAMTSSLCARGFD